MVVRLKMTPDHEPRSIRRRLAAAGGVVVFLLLCVLVLGIGSTNAVCGSCHAMRPYATSLARSSHASVSCYACHLPAGPLSWPSFKASELFQMYPAAMTGRGVSGAGVQVSRNACLSCHNTVMDRVVNKHGYRIVHSTCAASGPCDTCHGATAHGRQTRWIRTFVMEDCVSCHLEQRATTNCDACHVAKSTAERLASGPWQVTHGPNWRSTHGLGDTQLCATCHPPNYCVRCHHTPLPHGADFGGNHGTAARARDASCASCHNPTTFCLRCHGMPMPHPAGFLKMHSRVAKGSGDPLCLRCHYREDCDSCHAKHTHPGSTRGTLGGAKLPVIKP